MKASKNIRSKNMGLIVIAEKTKYMVVTRGSGDSSNPKVENNNSNK